jgi:predicted Ser/Thr protein kinase
VIAGRYTLEREIGRGGSGTVHLAHDEVLGRHVAIKRIGVMPGTTQAEVARAEREARIAAGLNHVNVVSVFDLVHEDDQHFLVMEYVDGQTLSQLVNASGPLDTLHAASLIGQVADALAEAHAAGIVHRDVKPSNVLVAEGTVAKLTDFGIARSQSDASLTQTGLVTGSPAYLAPEVASGGSSTTASDVWSLGATLYHCLSGRAPYEVGDNVIGALYKIVHEDPPRLPASEPLAGLLEVMLVKDPGLRWPMERVRDELRRVALGEEPTVRPALPLPDDEAVPAAATTVLPASRGTGTGTGTGAHTPIAPGPPPSPAAGGRGRRGTDRVLPLALVAGFVALALVAVAVIWLWPGDGQRPAAGPVDPASEPTSQGPSSPTAEPAKDASEVSAEIEGFVTDYLRTVTSDPEAAFEMLTPQFQQASGGFDGYVGWWSTVKSARPTSIDADPETLAVGYTVDYVMQSGEERTEEVSLQLERQDERYLIAGER